MTGLRKNIWQRLKSSLEFRNSYKAEHARSGVAYQIKAMREARHWNQADLAKKMGCAQSNIARLENPDYGKFNVQSLLAVADAFDVWLSIQFVPFSTGLRRTENRSTDALNVVSFDQDWESRPISRQSESWSFSSSVDPTSGLPRKK
jgi:transcriptional regulator with XRE-family HTH domain